MDTVNQDQLDYWNGDAGRRWTDAQEAMDVMLAPFSAAAMEAGGVPKGAEVIDVGCGCGGTSLELARRVGLMGRVLGVDISTPMLRRAQERAAAGGLTHVLFANADASTYRFEAGATDLVFSRFGVMFFRNAEAAFANLHAALRPGGRLAFACWRTLPENEWVTLPREVALRHVTPPPPPPPGEPGPFAFADPQRVRSLLEGAGFHEIVLSPFDHAMRQDGPLEAVAEAMATMGPASRLIAEAPADVRARIVEEIAETVAPRHDGTGVALASAAWVVTARG